MSFLSFLFGLHSKKVKKYLKNGAIILDVRTKKEFDSDAIKNAIHIPLHELHKRFYEVKDLNKPLIVYCKSGARASKAATFLNLKNIDAINGGGMDNLRRHM